MGNTTSKKKPYEVPRLTVVTFNVERGYAASGDLFGSFIIGNSWLNEGNDAWDGSGPAEGGNRFGGGWVDNGGSAWD